MLRKFCQPSHSAKATSTMGSLYVSIECMKQKDEAVLCLAFFIHVYNFARAVIHLRCGSLISTTQGQKTRLCVGSANGVLKTSELVQACGQQF